MCLAASVADIRTTSASASQCGGATPSSSWVAEVLTLSLKEHPATLKSDQFLLYHSGPTQQPHYCSHYTEQFTARPQGA